MIHQAKHRFDIKLTRQGVAPDRERSLISTIAFFQFLYSIAYFLLVSSSSLWSR